MPNKDPVKQRESSKRHYENNKEAMIARARVFNDAARIRNREIVEAYLRAHPCVDCGNDDIRVLEFDHVRGEKVAAVSKMALHLTVGLVKLKAEIAKCDIRCANCHRIVTWERRREKKLTDVSISD